MDAPVPGLCAVLAAHFLTVKAPKPRISTRSPRTSAAVISSSMAFTTISASPRLLRLRKAIRRTGSALFIDNNPATSTSNEHGKGAHTVKAGVQRRPNFSGPAFFGAVVRAMTVAGDRVPRSYRDDRDIAIGSAEYLKERNPTCEVAVRDLEGKGETRDQVAADYPAFATRSAFHFGCRL
jgi:hypothetical protein